MGNGAIQKWPTYARKVTREITRKLVNRGIPPVARISGRLSRLRIAVKLFREKIQKQR